MSMPHDNEFVDEVYADVERTDCSDIDPNSEIMRFFEYWQAITEAAGKAPGLPARADMDPIDIPTVIPWMFLVDVLREGGELDFRFRLIGTRNAELVRQDATGKRLGEAFPLSTADLMRRSYEEVVTAGEPRCWRAWVPDIGYSNRRCFRALFPFADDGVTVDLIAGLLMPIDIKRA